MEKQQQFKVDMEVVSEMIANDRMNIIILTSKVKELEKEKAELIEKITELQNNTGSKK